MKIALGLTVLCIAAVAAVVVWQGSTPSTPLRPGAYAPGSGVEPSDSQPGGTPFQVEARPIAAAVTIELADVEISTDNPDSRFERWLRGEWEAGNEESILPREELERLRREALEMPPDPRLQERSQAAATAPVVGQGFEALDYPEGGGGVPPDPAIAVGQDHLIVAVNTSLEIYDKSGSSVFGPTSGASFFTGLSSCTSGLYDPDVLYDEEEQRYMIAYDKGAVSQNGGYCLAVSASPNPLGAWHLYFVPTNTSEVWLDFPHAGIGDEHLVFGGNMFSMDGPYAGAQVWALAKDDVYAGLATTPTTTAVPDFNDTPQPLHLHGKSDGSWPDHGQTVYFLAETYDGRNYPVYRWAVDTNTVTAVGTADLGVAGFPVNSAQNGAGLLQGNDWRPHGFDYHAGHAWTSTTISCNPGAGTVNCVRWAQIDLTTGSLGPAGVGVIASDGDYRSFPALATNRCGDMAIGYTRSNTSEYPSVFATGRLAGDAAGTTAAEQLLFAGEISYTAFDGSPHRWGDYTGMAVDPDGSTLWYVGQYSKDTGTTNGRWATFVAPMSFADCQPVAIFDDGFEYGNSSRWSFSPS